MQECEDYCSRDSGCISLAAITLAAAAVPAVVVLTTVVLLVVSATAADLANQEDSATGTEAAGGYDFKLRHLESCVAAGVAGIITIAAHIIRSFHGEFDFP